ncbi:unnamed protein product [Effrenium voratum]|nr:unnamed protein product [Effrenium voratum]
MQVPSKMLALLLPLMAPASGLLSFDMEEARARPVNKVLTLLQGMKEQLETEDGFADYSANSGAWLHSHARGEDPTEAWGHQAQNQGSMQNDLKVLKDMGGFGSPEAAELLVDIATNMVLSCWAMGGRFWAASLKQGGDSHVSGSATLCAPESCAQREVETEVVPFWFSKIMKGAQLASAAVQELGHWADLALDFLLIGVDGCGTTALRRGLARHRLINFTTFSIHGVDEDFFLHEMGRNTLPFTWQVQRFAQRREESLGGLIGLYQAVIWKEDVLLYILEKVPDVKLIATVCDPVDRFERLVDFAGRAGLSFEEALEQELKAADDFGQLLKWQAAFQDRLFFVERDALSAPETYDDLAAFLGLPGFRAQRFWRYNENGDDKATSVEGAEAKIKEMEGKVAQLSALSAKLEVEYKNLGKDVIKNEASMDEVMAMRKKQLAKFQKDESDLLNSINNVKSATDVVASSQASFLQLTQREAITKDLQRILARHSSDLSSATSGELASFLQDPSTGNVQGVLQGLAADFEGDLKELQEEEKTNKAEYEMLIAADG